MLMSIGNNHALLHKYLAPARAGTCEAGILLNQTMYIANNHIPLFTQNP